MPIMLLGGGAGIVQSRADNFALQTAL